MERDYTGKSLSCALAVLSLLLVTSAALTPSQAADYSKIGVKAGTWAVYLEYSTPPFYPGEIGVIIIVNVLSVNNGVTAYNGTFYHPDGSHDPHLTTWNVSKGEGEVWVFFTPANLSAGDPINQDWGANWRINETIDSFIAAGVPRTVNHLSLRTGWGPYSNGSLDMYWDKLTGLVVRVRNFGGIGWLNRTLLGTSLWRGALLTDGTLTPLSGGGVATSPSGGTTTLLAGVAVVAVVSVVAGFLLGRHGKKR